jgi:Short C-terminal domain
MKSLIIIASMIILTACSTSSTIKKASESKSAFDDAAYEGEEFVVNNAISDEDAYRIFHQASTGFTSIQSIRNSAEKRASDFCKKQGKEMQTLRERTSSPPHILGNFPRIEIVFSCLKNKEGVEAINNNDKYKKIESLKRLLDDGALTNEEYQVEKTKILSK